MHDVVNNAIGDLLRAVPNKALGLIGKTTNQEGGILAPDVKVSLEALKVLSKDFSDLPEAEGRELVDEDAKLGAGRPVPVGSITETKIANTPVRIYRPANTDGQTLLPTLVYLHGGGWVLGSLNSHDNTARFFCHHAGVQVVLVDYPLAPEHRYPAGLNAVDEVLEAAFNGEIPGTDAAKIAVGGDSAGGNLSAAVCLRRAAQGKPQPSLQMLFVPVTDLAGMDTGSYREFADGFYLTHKQMLWYRARYLTDLAEAELPEVSPLRAPQELLSKVAPAYIAVAGFDPLRDEGRAYGTKLAAAGVPVSVVTHEGLIHPWVNTFAIWDDARNAMHQAAGALRLALGVGA